MADPFMAEIRIFPFKFAPRGWAFCDGQLLPRPQNDALYSLLLDTYGGNGETNFALPDLQGRAPMKAGQGPGLPGHGLGERGGSDTVTLLETQMPSHAHAMNAEASAGNLNGPDNAVLARPFGGGNLYKTPAGAPIVALSDQSIETYGGGQAHNNLMPYLTLSFCICLQGIYPPRPPSEPSE